MRLELNSDEREVVDTCTRIVGEHSDDRGNVDSDAVVSDLFASSVLGDGSTDEAQRSALALIVAGRHSVHLATDMLAGLLVRGLPATIALDHNDAVGLAISALCESRNRFEIADTAQNPVVPSGSGVWLSGSTGVGLALAAVAGSHETVVLSVPADSENEHSRYAPVLATGLTKTSVAGVLDAKQTRGLRIRAMIGVAAALIGIIDSLKGRFSELLGEIPTEQDRWNGQGHRHQLADLAMYRTSAWLHLVNATAASSDPATADKFGTLACESALSATHLAVPAIQRLLREHGDVAGLVWLEEIERAVQVLDYVTGGTIHLRNAIAQLAVAESGGRSAAAVRNN